MLLGSLMKRRDGARSKLLDDLSFLKQEPTEIFRSHETRYVSWNRLNEFRKDPVLFHKRLQRVLPQATPQEDIVDRAALVRLLEGKEAYDAQFVSGAPVDPKTGKPFSVYSREYEQWAAAQEKTVLKEEQANLVEQLDYSVRNHPHAQNLLADGVAQGVVRTVLRGLYCQSCINWLNRHKGIVSLMFCDGLYWVETHLRNGVVHELAFQHDLVKEMTGKSLPAQAIVVEKSLPHRCGVWQIGRSLLRKARKENLATITQFIKCLESDRWPSGYEEVRVLKPSFI